MWLQLAQLLIMAQLQLGITQPQFILKYPVTQIVGLFFLLEQS
ncbi:hypothetical protein B0G52_118164 [Cohnella sp. SGD-V74]|nr:hypothetical protein B0G52_118164 [Cohnella sp. SGD-V74]